MSDFARALFLVSSLSMCGAVGCSSAPGTGFSDPPTASDEDTGSEPVDEDTSTPPADEDTGTTKPTVDSGMRMDTGTDKPDTAVADTSMRPKSAMRATPVRCRRRIAWARSPTAASSSRSSR